MILGNRRFRVLSPTLVRAEFSPYGVFEDRRSMVAYAAQAPLEFLSKQSLGEWDVLDTGSLQVWTKDNAAAPNRLNLEIRWTDGRFLQFWRPGDQDYQNLGGTLRSLDRYAGPACDLDGVHPAGMESPDTLSTTWVAWNQDEVDPALASLHPDPPDPRGHADWLDVARASRNGERFPARTWNVYKGARKFGPGLLSEAGFFFLNDSNGAVLDEEDFPVERNHAGSLDWYFFAYGKDYKRALGDFRLLSGAAPMMPKKSLGIIFSRWPAFTMNEAEHLAASFTSQGYPISTLVMDMEWHKEGWGHWDFDPELLPDPKGFFARCHELGMDVALNDHPLDVRGDDSHFHEYVVRGGSGVNVREREYKGRHLQMASVDICNKEQNRAFREVCESHLWEIGLDYLWNDGCRGQMAVTSGQLVSSKSFFEDSMRHGRRGMHLARYGGLGSHRYGAFFTGDANSDYDVLRLQCEFNIRAAGAGLSHISHDIGGFALDPSGVIQNKQGTPIIDPVRFLRWLQFGVFNPVLRFHSAPGCGSRRPDDYDVELDGACRHWLRIRHSLLPYIYTAMCEYHETGIPLTRGLYLLEPANPAAYRFDEYFFGPDVLVAPILCGDSARTIYLPGAADFGGWWEFETSNFHKGNCEFSREVAVHEVPVYVRAGSIIPRQDPDAALYASHVEMLVLDVYPGADGTAFLYEDDGCSEEYLSGSFCRSKFQVSCDGNKIVISGRVAEGRPLGESRKFLIHVALPCPPESAVDDQGDSVAWTALAAPGRYSFVMGERCSRQPWSLQIHSATIPCDPSISKSTN